MHFEIQADDIERVKKFYEKTLGWKISQVMAEEKGDMMDYWMINTGKDMDGPGIDGGLYKRPQEVGQKFYLYDCTITVPDIDKAVEDVKANGGEITKEKMEIKGVGLFAGAKDTEGNRFGLIQATDWKP